MDRLRHRFLLRLRSFFHHRRVENELTDELRFHLDKLIDLNLAAGMSAREARQSALREMGGLELIKEECRDARRVNYILDLLQDLRFGLRISLRSARFSAVAALTLALGIASMAVLFSILDCAYLHFPGPRNGHHFVVLSQRFTKRQADSWRFSPAEYFDIAGLHRGFDGWFAVSHESPALTENGERGGNPERVPVARVTANFFSLFGIPPLLGREFTPQEDRPGGPDVAVVTWRLWMRRFGGDPGLIGKTITLDNLPCTVIGITPRGFQHWGADVYLPAHLDPASSDRSQRTLTVAAVMNGGISARDTGPALGDLARRLENQHASENPEYAGLVYTAYDVRDVVVGDLRAGLYVLLGAVVMLLLITAANIASLLLARTRARAREIGTRLALGATPARLARQFLTESALLSFLAGLLGFVLGLGSLGPVLALVPEHYIGEGTDVHASAGAFILSLSVAIILGLAFGMAPAIFISRRGVAGNIDQSRGASSADRSGGRVRALLVLVEVALAFIVVTGVGLMFRTYRQITALDLGFRPDHVLTMRIALADSKYRGTPEVANFFRELLGRVRPLAGVTGAAASSARPMDGTGSRDFAIPGRSLNSAGGMATAAYRIITPEYFTVIRTPLLDGRFFTDQDGPRDRAVGIVNERFARLYFAHGGAVGRQIRLENGAGDSVPGSLVEIVGVVADSRQLTQWSAMSELYAPAQPEIFVPFFQHPEAGRDMALLIRTSTDPATLTDPIRRAVLGIDPTQPVYDVETLQTMADLTLGPARLCLFLLGIFAIAALLTACVGLYGIVSWTVAQRTQEIGIRMALGARRRDVLSAVLREEMLVVATGLAVGMVASFGMTRFMSTLLYRVPSNDLPTITAVSCILIGVTALASYFPARRAAKLDPMVALRYQ